MIFNIKMGGIGVDMNWFEALLYGLISGITEFLPVSAQAHQMILLNLFGCSEAGSLLNLFVHIGMLAALLVTSGAYIARLYKEYQFSKQTRRRRKRELNMQSVFDIRLVRIACVPVIAGFVFYGKTLQWNTSVPIVALFMLLNGIILLIPMYLARGNKDSRSMSSLDGILFGIGSALSVFPGVSRVGAGCSFVISRGAAPQHAYKWSLILSVPVLLILSCFDVYSLFVTGFGQMDFLSVLQCLFSGAFAYLGATVAITFMKTLTARSGIAGFSYYSFGAALFAFILYLY